MTKTHPRWRRSTEGVVIVMLVAVAVVKFFKSPLDSVVATLFVLTKNRYISICLYASTDSAVSFAFASLTSCIVHEVQS